MTASLCGKPRVVLSDERRKEMEARAYRLDIRRKIRLPPNGRKEEEKFNAGDREGDGNYAFYFFRRGLGMSLQQFEVFAINFEGVSPMPNYLFKRITDTKYSGHSSRCRSAWSE